MKFEIEAVKHINGKAELAKFYYDNETSRITNSKDEDIVIKSKEIPHYSEVFIQDPVNNPLNKSEGEDGFRVIKIQLGLSCNYSCEYCSQRFVPHADNGNPEAVKRFMNNLDKWLKKIPKKIEFWGGEPFVYWKTLRPLVEKLRIKFPNVKFSIITNGSLLSSEINDWIEENNISIGISHDGPGQKVRGSDPFENEEQKKNILDLFNRLNPKKKISFNSMIHRENLDRTKIQEFFKEKLGTDNFHIGEGGYIDSYDEGGLANALRSEAEMLGFRRLSLEQIRANKTSNFNITNQRIKEWIDSVKYQRPSSVLMQKCGMDRPDTIAIDLFGNVLTCQNVSAISKAPNGKSHKIGHVSNLDAVKLETSKHWSVRDNCSKCPMLQACKGSCMFLEDKLFYKSCDSSYNDNLPFFAAAFELMTGYLPYRINGSHLPEIRQNLWGNIEDNTSIPSLRE